MNGESEKVAILMATYNGSKWLNEQLDSIFTQQSVSPELYVSDDQSTDSTVEILDREKTTKPINILPVCCSRFGNAARNFLRLIVDSEIGDSQFIALADQDDIWLPSKLNSSLEKIRKNDVDVYSSNATAFWSCGREKLIVKSQPQVKFDYLFESAGPGCTFVMKRDFYDCLRNWLISNADRLQNILVHDWLIYAYARANGYKWYIDPQSHILYRQHSHNSIGINSGFKAAKFRLKKVRTGDYLKSICTLAETLNENSAITESIKTLELKHRIFLIFKINNLRRRIRDRLALALLLLVAKN